MVRFEESDSKTPAAENRHASKTEKFTVMLNQTNANKARQLALNNKIDKKPYATLSAIIDHGLMLALKELEN
ncbi:MAG: hypothetical protein CMN28_12255 [Salinisphaeraceae bacterium]|nr:hypothetical protein [Salinisphaeraceae bacterium]